MTRLVAGGIVVIVLVETMAFLADPRLALPVAGLAVAGFVLTALSRLAGAEPPPLPAATTGAGEALRRWRSQTETLIAWADGTRGDWDRHLRPRLAREFLLATGHKDAESQQDAGRMVFGDDLWPWVDPHAVSRADTRAVTPAGSGAGRDAPGPGRAALQEILRRLEQI